MTFALSLSMPIKRGRLQEALELLGSAIDRVQQETGCLAFQVCTSDVPDTIFIYEAYESREYHDEVHEAFPEIRHVLENVGDLVDGVWEMHELEVIHARK